MLRDFVLYRMNNIIADPLIDIPKYLNSTYIGNLFPKLNKQIDKKRFSNYYEWVSLSFPEYASNWSIKDFNDTVAYDNTVCGSKQEVLIYELIKRDMGFSYIESIGNKRKGKYIYELGNDYEYERFCPDFVIEYLDIDNKKVKLNKPIIIEYYGMFSLDNLYYVFVNYKNKTLVKKFFL